MEHLDEKTILFEQTAIPRAVAKLAIPTILSSLVMVIYNLADTYFVGMLNDPVQNAAVTLAAPVLLAFNAINNLFGVGSSSMTVSYTHLDVYKRQVQHIAGKYTRLKDATFQLRKGEILGIAGLDGSGRTEVLENLFGAMTREGGSIKLHGKEIQNRSPREAIKNGFALLTEERRATGIFGIRDIKENTVISSLKDYLVGGLFLSDKKMRKDTEWAIQALSLIHI